MPNVSPTLIFWISFAVSIGVGITGGTVHLTHIVPAEYMDAVTAWVALFVFTGSSFLTMVAGIGMTKQNRLASAASMPEVKSIVVSTSELAAATPSDKVISR